MKITKQQTILIVDDSKLNINFLANHLRTDFKIRVATGGEKALEIAFSENPPDLILLDVVMPDIDGYEVCKKLNNSIETKNIPIIFITGKTSGEDEIYGFSIGAVDYIAKPFNPVVVKARVNTHLELKRYRDYLEDVSYFDGLTGIPNRRKFDEQFELMWNLSKRESVPISIIMMDIDFFKAFNDGYGHQAGDECLRRIAQALSKVVVRKTDLIARYGGEEFVCVLLNTTIEGAAQFAEKLRESIISLHIPHEGSQVDIQVTISLGVATDIPNKDSLSKRLIQAADDALYKSKKNGRNKVTTQNLD